MWQGAPSHPKIDFVEQQRIRFFSGKTSLFALNRENKKEVNDTL